MTNAFCSFLKLYFFEINFLSIYLLNIFFKSTIHSSLEKKINCLSIIEFYVVLKLQTDTIFKMLIDLIKKYVYLSVHCAVQWKQIHYLQRLQQLIEQLKKQKSMVQETYNLFTHNMITLNMFVRVDLRPVKTDSNFLFTTVTLINIPLTKDFNTIVKFRCFS